MDKQHPDMKMMTFADQEKLAERFWKPLRELPWWDRATVHLNPNVIDELLELIYSKPRKNQGSLTNAEKDNFNSAIQQSIGDGSYNTIAQIHSVMSHNMHGFMGFTGAMRFLPWHRVYLHVMEQQLQMYEPDLRIPYWDWANDHSLPGWLMLPSGVTRGPNNSYPLPSQSDIDNTVLNQTVYANFTQALEGYHNTVHMYVGGNTMPYPSISPHDPMFWLHHANVDRIWATWQQTYPGVLEPLAGTDAIMDPWADTITSANDTYEYYYFYA